MSSFIPLSLYEQVKKYPFYPFSSSKVEKTPDKGGLKNNISGIYILFNGDFGFLYIGKGTNIRQRLRSHLGFCVAWCRSRVYYQIVEDDISVKEISIIVFPVNTELERRIFELRLISKYKPRYNLDIPDNDLPSLSTV